MEVEICRVGLAVVLGRLTVVHEKRGRVKILLLPVAFINMVRGIGVVVRWPIYEVHTSVCDSISVRGREGGISVP